MTTNQNLPGISTNFWDSKAQGEPQELHLFKESDGNLTLDITEKCLRLAQRHAHQLKIESTKAKSIQKFFLLGSLNVDQDARVIISIDRFDPGRKISRKEGMKSLHVPTAVIPGDVIIPITMQMACIGSEGLSPYCIGEYYDAFQSLLKNLKLSCDSVDVKDMLSLKIHATYYEDTDEVSINVSSGVVVPSAFVTAVPILPISIVPTALARSLSGPLHLNNVRDTQKSGYIAINNSHNMLLVLDSDPKLSSIPLVGIIRNGSTGFLLILYGQTRAKPEFWECSFLGKPDEFLYCQASEDIFMEKFAKNRTELVHLQLIPDYMNNAFLQAKETFIMESTKKRSSPDIKPPESQPIATPHSKNDQIQQIISPIQEVDKELEESDSSFRETVSSVLNNECKDQEKQDLIDDRENDFDKNINYEVKNIEDDSSNSNIALIENDELVSGADEETVEPLDSNTNVKKAESTNDSGNDTSFTPISNERLNNGLNETYEDLAQTELKKLLALAQIRKAREQLAKEESEILSELKDIRNRKELLWTALTNGDEPKAESLKNDIGSSTVEEDQRSRCSIPEDGTKDGTPMNDDSMILKSDSDLVSSKSSLSQPVAEENNLQEQSHENSVSHHDLQSIKSDSVVSESEQCQEPAYQDNSFASVTSKEESKVMVERTREIQLYKITKEWMELNVNKDTHRGKENNAKVGLQLVSDANVQHDVHTEKEVESRIGSNRSFRGHSANEFSQTAYESNSCISTDMSSNYIPSAERICEKYLKRIRPLQSLKSDNNMSFATVRYMERHNLLNGTEKKERHNLLSGTEKKERHKLPTTPAYFQGIVDGGGRYRSSITQSIEVSDVSYSEDASKMNGTSNLKVLDISRLKHLPKLM